MSDLWATDELWVESFSISDQGFFYLLGVPQEIYLSLGRPGVTSGRRVTNLVHIFDDQFQRVASLIPTEITPGNIRVVLQILRESTITIRANGNFFVTLSPMTSQLINADLVTTSQQIIEYDPLGNIFEVHSVPAEAPTTPVSAVVPDGDGGLVVQFARVEAKEPSFPHPGGPIVGQTGRGTADMTDATNAKQSLTWAKMAPRFLMSRGHDGASGAAPPAPPARHGPGAGDRAGLEFR